MKELPEPLGEGPPWRQGETTPRGVCRGKGGAVLLRGISRLSTSLEGRGKVTSSMEKQAYPYPYLWLRELKSQGEIKPLKEFIR